jgi:hypothetical protein
MLDKRSGLLDTFLLGRKILWKTRYCYFHIYASLIDIMASTSRITMTKSSNDIKTPSLANFSATATRYLYMSSKCYSHLTDGSTIGSI